MLVWTISDFVAKKTQSLLALAGVVVGFIIVHLGTLISIDDFKKQWKTLLIGISTVFGIGIALWIAALIFGARAPPAGTRGWPARLTS